MTETTTKVQAFQAGVTIAEYGENTYMYHAHADTWFIFEKTLGWVFPVEEEIPDIEKLDYMMFNDGESIH